jgi:hypothetical protein
MNPTIPERAAKIRETIQTLPTEVVQTNKQFYDELWSFCGAVIDAFEQGGGQFVPPPLLSD